MFQHKGVWLPDGDTHFVDHLDKGPVIDGVGTYQLSKLEAAVDAYCTKTRVAIDIGAHVGLWSRILAIKFQTILAFEPVPAHTECFIKNLVRKGTCRVHLFPVALGNEDGVRHILTTADNSGNAHLNPNGSGGIQVKMRRLDDYVLDHHQGIDFIKVDVEGAELDVVKGAKETIRRYKPVMVVEQKKGHGQRYGVPDTAAVDLLKTWGAQVMWMKNGDYCLKW